MSNNTRYVVIAFAVIAVALAVVIFRMPAHDEGPSKVGRRLSDADQSQGQMAAQIDPSSPSANPEPRDTPRGGAMGSDEFFSSLASALTGEGFTDDYIAAVARSYRGYDPRDFLAIDSSTLAEQLSQQMQDDLGYYRVTTNDAADILRVAHEVYGDLQ